MRGVDYALILGTALGCGVMGGVFFAFSVAVMPALGRIPAPQGIAAMQSVNRVIINPVFMLVFLGTAVACLVVGIRQIVSPQCWFLLAGALLSVVGSFGVTIACNVPLNNALDAADPDSEAGAALWARYLRVWTAWNHVRTIACLAAAGLLTAALAELF
jgi:uncharacterized membrane protein